LRRIPNHWLTLLPDKTAGVPQNELCQADARIIRTKSPAD